MANGVNPWLASAYANTANPNQDYQSYLAGLGINVDPEKVGKFFGGITEDYQQDINMARAGLDQSMGQGRMMGQQAMFNLGGGQGISSGFGGGFGRKGYGMMQGIGGIGQQYGQTLASGLLGYTGDLQSAQRRMQSQFRDVATGLLGRDAAGISQTEGTNDSWLNNIVTNLPSTNEGSKVYQGNVWEWSEEEGQYVDTGQTVGNLGGGGYSDIRLKEDINYIFTMDNGVPIYTFKYKWSDDVNIGTMAQDIEDMIPEAVSINSNGYKMVDYSKVLNYGI
jgi:hypothetical protein